MSSLSPSDGTQIGAGFSGSLRHGAALVGCTKDGLLFPALIIERPESVPEDWVVPRESVHEAVSELFERYAVARMVCHRAEWLPEIDRWAERYGEDGVLQVSLGRMRFGPMIDRLRSAAIQGTVRHTGDEALRRHMSNARMDNPREGYRLLRRAEPGRPIDAAIAAALALDASVAIQEESMPGIEVIDLGPRRDPLDPDGLGRESALGGGGWNSDGFVPGGE